MRRRKIDKGVTVEPTVTMGKTHYEALLREIEQLRARVKELERKEPEVFGTAPIWTTTSDRGLL